MGAQCRRINCSSNVHREVALALEFGVCLGIVASSRIIIYIWYLFRFESAPSLAIFTRIPHNLTIARSIVSQKIAPICSRSPNRRNIRFFSCRVFGELLSAMGPRSKKQSISDINEAGEAENSGAKRKEETYMCSVREKEFPSKDARDNHRRDVNQMVVNATTSNQSKTLCIEAANDFPETLTFERTAGNESEVGIFVCICGTKFSGPRQSKATSKKCEVAAQHEGSFHLLNTSINAQTMR